MFILAICNSNTGREQWPLLHSLSDGRYFKMDSFGTGLK